MNKSPLSDREILALCNKYYDASSALSTITDERQKSLDAYNGELYGDEVEGRSQVVTSEVYETIESIVPDMIEVFVSPDNAVVFEARNAQDVEAAQLETDYCNYVFREQNPGFMVARTWIIDALLQKNGVVRVYWDDRKEIESETYEGIGPLEYVQLYTDPEADIKAVTYYFAGEEVEATAAEGLDPELFTFDVKVERTVDKSQIRIENVLPEDFFVEPFHDSIMLDSCGYYSHRMRISRDVLLERFTVDQVDKIPDYEDISGERASRYVKENSGFGDSVSENKEIIVHFIKFDNGDGYKRYRIETAGDQVLEMDEFDGVEYHVLCPIPLPHQYNGKSKGDETVQLQRINTTFMRQTIDSLVRSNASQKIVKRQGNVDLKALTSGRAGQVVLADDVTAVQEIKSTFVGGDTLPFFQYMEGMKERRTGVSQAQQGLTPEALANSTNLVGAMIMNRAQSRIKLIARTFGETGFKSLYLEIHKLSCKYQTQVKTLDFGAGFVDVDPQQWKKRSDMTVKVGVGFAEKQDRVANLINIINYQEKLAMAGSPIVGQAEIYASLTDLGKVVGVAEVKKYFKDPATIPPAEPQPSDIDKQLSVLKEQGIIDLQKKAAELEATGSDKKAQLAFDRHKFDREMDFKRDQLDEQIAVKVEELLLKYKQEALKPVTLPTGGNNDLLEA